MTRSATPWLRRTELLALGAALALAATGCVTKGRYDEVVGGLEEKNGQLEARVEDLQRSNESLDQERVKLIDQMEDLREEHKTLSRDVEELSKSKDLLTEHLRKRESEVQELSQLKGTYSGLVSELESEVAAGQIQIEQLRDGIRLNLPQDILFSSGSATLDPRGVEVLRKVASKLHEHDHRIEVQGHTDNVPISGALAARYNTNWELAAARAASVVRLLQTEKLDPHRLKAISYGEWDPVASNDTAEGRAKNRRIEIRLIPVKGPADVADTSSAPATPQAPPAPAASPASVESPPPAPTAASEDGAAAE
jgi:chemotaxis protein MotB